MGAAQRGMNSFSIDSSIGKGTKVKMSKWLPFLSSNYKHGFSSAHDKKEQFSSHFKIAESSANTILVGLLKEKKDDRNTSFCGSLKDLFKHSSDKPIKVVYNSLRSWVNKNNSIDTIQFGLISITENKLEYILNGEINLSIVSTNNNQENYCAEKNNSIGVINISKFKNAIFLLSKKKLSLDSSLYQYHPQVVADYLTKNYAKTFNDGGLLVLKKIENA